MSTVTGTLVFTLDNLDALNQLINTVENQVGITIDASNNNLFTATISVDMEI